MSRAVGSLVNLTEIAGVLLHRILTSLGAAFVRFLRYCSLDGAAAQRMPTRYPYSDLIRAER